MPSNSKSSTRAAQEAVPKTPLITQQKLVPHLWFDTEAKEAAEFYTSIFPNSAVTNVTTLRDTPSGDTGVVAFHLSGHSFVAISAGPLFRFNPSISFMLNFDPSKDKNARKNLDETWRKLSRGGRALMELDKYPFSERYGWIEDKYGLSWQLILSDPKGEPRPFIVPSLMFVGKLAGRAEEAIKLYTSVFKDSRTGNLARHAKGKAPDKEGTLMFADFMLEGQWFAAMDSAQAHAFAFNEAVSFMVNCKDQKEIDHYWQKLSAVPEAEQCGWLKDRFGVSWQVTPAALGEMLMDPQGGNTKRLMDAFLKMGKLDVQKLKEAYRKK